MSEADNLWEEQMEPEEYEAFFSRLRQDLGQETRFCTLSIETSPGPPSLSEVAGVYETFDDELDRLWMLSEVLEYVVAGKEMPTWASDRIAKLKRLMSMAYPVHPEDNPYRGYYHTVSSGGSFSQPQTKVYGSRYSNPLVTLIAVMAGAAILFMLTTVWSMRQFAKLYGEKELQAQRSKYLELFAEEMTKGDPQNREAAEAVFTGIMQMAHESIDKMPEVSVKIPAGPLGAFELSLGD